MTDFSTPHPQYALVHIWPPSIPPVAYVLNACPISQPKIQARALEYRIHWNINIQKKKKIPYEKTNGSVGWNEHSGEQY